MPQGYALKLNATAGDATLAQFSPDGGWVILPVAPDTDPAVPALWFALPNAVAPNAVDDSLALFTGDPTVASPVNPAAVFLRFEDFNTCALSNWVTEELDNTLIDSTFDHRDGGCSFLIRAAVTGFTSLHTFEKYSRVAVDAWWSIEQGAPMNTDINTGNGVLEQYPVLSGLGFGWVTGYGGWIGGELLVGDFTPGMLHAAPPADRKWRRTMNGVGDTGLIECLDGVCSLDTTFGPPLQVFDAGSCSVGRRVNYSYSDGGERVWVDDIIVRPFQWPEPIVGDAGVYLGPGAPCSDAGTPCASGNCNTEVCAPFTAGLTHDAGPDAQGPALRVGCDCGSTPFGPLAWAIALALGVRRRAKSAARCR